MKMFCVLIAGLALALPATAQSEGEAPTIGADQAATSGTASGGGELPAAVASAPSFDEMLFGWVLRALDVLASSMGDYPTPLSVLWFPASIYGHSVVKVPYHASEMD